MGDGPVAGSTPASWGLTGEHARQAQGLVVSPFEHLREAEALFLQLPAGGAWLAALRARVPITAASGKATPSTAIAFTATGLARIGLDDKTLASFSVPFREGMHEENRRRRLSDLEELATVIPGGPTWRGSDGAPTPAVHAVLLLYEGDAAALQTLVANAEQVLQANAVAISHRLRLWRQEQEREHFGFADGMSQPIPYGKAIRPPSGAAAEAAWHGIPAGEILMGHVNGHDELAPGPLVIEPEPQKPQALRDAWKALPTEGAPEGLRNLGMDGSYLVVRELRQDVAGFWQSMDQAAAALGGGTTADWVAERVIGRTKAGELLTPPGGTLPKGTNAFGFIDRDPRGLGCPLGAHIRRANPRDGLARDAESGPALLRASNNHRILRRGRKFGPPATDPRLKDDAVRGLLFMALNTDIERQFEFIQQTWLMNESFATLLDETDPLVGPKGAFTIPSLPVRLRADVRAYIQLAGGEYFFLPSIPALDFLGALP
jgi:deferrochelatase/peroxidase EfeB